MCPQHETPEDQLLRIIRSGDDSERASVKTGPKKAGGDIKDGAGSDAAKEPRVWSFMKVNFLVLMIIVGLGLLVGLKYNRIQQQEFDDAVPNTVGDTAPLKDGKILAVSVPSYESMRQVLSRRDPFVAVWELKEEEPDITETVQTASIGNFLAQYKLAGIVLDESKMAIIQDTRQQTMVFVEPGDRIGDAVVIDIFPEKVILESHGQEMELTMSVPNM